MNGIVRMAATDGTGFRGVPLYALVAGAAVRPFQRRTEPAGGHNADRLRWEAERTAVHSYGTGWDRGRPE